MFESVDKDFILGILDRCPLQIYTTRYPPISDVVSTENKSGLQIDQMEFLRRYLKKNFTYFKSWDMGRWNENANTTELKSGLSILGYLTFAPLPDLNFLRKFHLSYYINVDKYVLIVPINYDLNPVWMNMLFIFKWDLWVGCAVIYALMVASIWIRVYVYRILVTENPGIEPTIIKLVKTFKIGKLLLALFQANLGKSNSSPANDTS